MKITRRKLLACLPLLGLTGLSATAAAAPGETAYMDRIFRDPAAARRLGAACRACGLTASRPLPETDSLSFQHWHRALDQQIREDFATGRIELVNGMYLSRTEISV